MDKAEITQTQIFYFRSTQYLLVFCDVLCRRFKQSPLNSVVDLGMVLGTRKAWVINKCISVVYGHKSNMHQHHAFSYK